MDPLWIVFLLSAGLLLAFCAVPVQMALRFLRLASHTASPAPEAATAGKDAIPVSVILPCRGLEPGLDEHIRSIAEQPYADLEVLLVTTDDDASLPLLRRIAGEPSSRCRVVVAPASHRGAQKLTNQRAGIRAASRRSGAFVFVDSDGKYSRTFLRDMLEPLGQPNVGMVTGWFWYAPIAGRFWSYVRSAWGVAAMPFLLDNRYNIAWGGAMAVRRGVFERTDAYEQWETSVSDDMTLARGVKKLGLKIHFAPQCIVAANQHGTFGEVLEWSNRQATISHVYMPEFWRFTAIAHGISLLLLVATMAQALSVFGIWAAAAPLAIYVAALGLNTTLLLTALNRLMPEMLPRGTWTYYLAAPTATVLYGINLMRSLCSRTITWRGITYEMVAAGETRIYRSTPEPIVS